MQYPHRSTSGSCAVMKVDWLTREAYALQREVSAGIQILIPGEQSSFHLIYRTVDGREQKAFVRGPHVAIIPAQHPYLLDCDRQLDVVVITLDQAFFEQKTRAVFGREAPRLVAQYSAADAFLRELGNSLRSELQMFKVPSAAYLECVAAVVAILLARQRPSDHATPQSYQGLAPHKLKRVQSFITDHFGETVRLAQLAQIVHMSPFHFAHVFKKATGKSPHVYITAERMERAKALLRDSELALVAVAAHVGFQTQAHFTGVFRKYCGVTPRVFRLHCQAARLESERGAQERTPQDCLDGTHDAFPVDRTDEAQDSRIPAQRPARNADSLRLS
jgi:AraC family transcriptional regulator